MRRWRRNLGAAALALALLGATVACAGGGDDDGGGGDSESAGDAGVALEAPETREDGLSMAELDQDDQQAAESAGGGSEGGTDAGLPDVAARPPLQTRAVISVGQVTLRADNLLEVRDGIDRMLGKYGGFVADEQTSNDGKGRTVTSTLTVRVPAPKFDEAMREFDELGTVSDASRKSEDVTTEVIDVDARIRTEEVSLRRLRGFLAEASSVATMIRLEAEIARREADLASLRSQQRYLEDQTGMSTIMVTMHLDRGAPPPPKPEDDPLEDAGFLTGLSSGWNALLDILLVVATVIGALIPFLVLLGVLGLPAYLWLRRHRPVAPPVAPPAGSEAG